MTNRPRWIVFDAVGTLMTPEPAVAVVYAAAARTQGVDVPVDVVRQRFRLAFRESETACFPEPRRGRTSEAEELARWRWIVRTVLHEVSDAERCFQQLWDHFANPAHWRVYDDVPRTLSELQQRGIGVAIASNFDARLHTVCDGLAALADIDRVFVSSTLGARKPDAQFYRHIEQELQEPPPALLMVGDDPICDLEGPLRCGWQARRIDRSTTPAPGVWNSLAELIAWLDHIGAE